MSSTLQTCRGFQTKLRLLEAIDSPITDISVDYLCEKSGVSRSTFYRCFKSKYDILPWWGAWCAEQYIFLIGRKYTWEEGYLRGDYLFKSEADVLHLGFGKGDEVPYFGGYPYALRHAEVLRETVTMRTGQDPDPLLDECIIAFCHLESDVTIYGSGKAFYPPKPLEETRFMLSLVPPIIYDACQLDDGTGKSREERFGELEAMDAALQEYKDFSHDTIKLFLQAEMTDQ